MDYGTEKNKQCVICSKDESSYKCPGCYKYYCSLLCFKTHKGNCVTVAKKDNSKDVSNTEQNVTPDTVSSNRLERLSLDNTIKGLLKNPHLRNVLKDIDGAKNAEEIMQKAMLEPIFVELADACLKVIDHHPT